MKIEVEGSYICKIKGSGLGDHHAHMLLLAGYDTDSHPMIDFIVSGPYAEPETAWLAHRMKRAGQEPPQTLSNPAGNIIVEP